MPDYKKVKLISMYMYTCTLLALCAAHVYEVRSINELYEIELQYSCQRQSNAVFKEGIPAKPNAPLYTFYLANFVLTPPIQGLTAMWKLC